MNSKVSIILLLTLFLTLSCKDFKTFKQTRAELIEKRKQDRLAQDNQPDNALESNPIELNNPQNSDSLFLSYERTPCYGRCPIYKVKIYQSGYMTYEGINFVDDMGYNHSRAEDKEVTEIYKWLTDSQFFEMQDSYDDEHVTDLPAKIIEVNAMGQRKKIKARYKFPEELKTLFRQIDDMVSTKDWKPIENINNQ